MRTCGTRGLHAALPHGVKQPGSVPCWCLHLAWFQPGSKQQQGGMGLPVSWGGSRVCQLRGLLTGKGKHLQIQVTATFSLECLPSPRGWSNSADQVRREKVKER